LTNFPTKLSSLRAFVHIAAGRSFSRVDKPPSGRYCKN
jgi:hypothetical protein